METVGTITFRQFSGGEIPSVEDYVRDYCKQHPTVEILIGTDSQNKGDKTTYSTVIALYEPGHGAHCIFKRWREPRERVRSVRLMNEVWASLNLAEELVKAGIKKPKYIDIDINPSPKFKSNEVYTSARGMIEGMGYEVRFKSFGPLVTTMADWVVKS